MAGAKEEVCLVWSTVQTPTKAKQLKQVPGVSSDGIPVMISPSTKILTSGSLACARARERAHKHIFRYIHGCLPETMARMAQRPLWRGHHDLAKELDHQGRHVFFHWHWWTEIQIHAFGDPMESTLLKSDTQVYDFGLGRSFAGGNQTNGCLWLVTEVFQLNKIGKKCSSVLWGRVNSIG